MFEFVVFIGCGSVVVLLISFRYQKTREKLQPNWWYALSAICIVSHLAFIWLIHEEFPIIAIILFVCVCVLSYITCKIAVIEDRLRRTQKR